MLLGMYQEEALRSALVRFLFALLTPNVIFGGTLEQETVCHMGQLIAGGLMYL